jgi:hypothetical protein
MDIDILSKKSWDARGAYRQPTKIVNNIDWRG